jgi:putative endonuclease
MNTGGAYTAWPVFMDSGLRPSAGPGMTVEGNLPFYVYILASRRHGTLYLGVTRNLVRRVYEHKTKAAPGFTKRYNVDRLVWFEIHDEVLPAIAREKELKKWRRDWKIRLIEESNPNWVDLYEGIAQ